MLFDADEYHQSGQCPWTFFAYPTSLADAQGLPPDKSACELLSCLEKHGIDVAIWGSAPDPITTYFACRIEDRQRLSDLLHELQTSGTIEPDFCRIRSERLFAKLEKGPEQRVADEAFDQPF